MKLCKQSSVKKRIRLQPYTTFRHPPSLPHYDILRVNLTYIPESGLLIFSFSVRIQSTQFHVTLERLTPILAKTSVFCLNFLSFFSLKGECFNISYSSGKILAQKIFDLMRFQVKLSNFVTISKFSKRCQFCGCIKFC